MNESLGAEQLGIFDEQLSVERTRRVYLERVADRLARRFGAGALYLLLLDLELADQEIDRAAGSACWIAPRHVGRLGLARANIERRIRAIAAATERPALETERPIDEDVEGRASELLYLNGITDGPVDVDAIAFGAGLSFELVDFDRCSGAYVAHLDGRAIALIKRTDSPARRRFTKGHELAHHLLEDAAPAHAARGRGRHRQHERFAACLLMPRRAIHSTATRAAGRGICGEQLVGHVAELFDVSRAAAYVRLTELGLLATRTLVEA